MNALRFHSLHIHRIAHSQKDAMCSLLIFIFLIHTYTCEYIYLKQQKHVIIHTYSDICFLDAQTISISLIHLTLYDIRVLKSEYFR